MGKSNSERQRAWRKANPEKRRAYQREWMRQYRERKKQERPD